MEARRTDARVAAMVAAHGEALRRVARRYSASAEDAEDAVQRGLEIYVRRLARVDPATELAWLKVVVRHEALAVGRARGETVAGEFDLDAQPAPDQRSLDELVAGRERAGRVAEALRRLKPDEARALLLKADGLSYGEIGERMAWSYTKVNRALTEGRKRFFEVYGEIETGEACERAAPALAALARGRADAHTLVELRPHLRHCSACRATVRRMHRRRRVRAAALAPVPWLQGLAQRLQGADVLAGAQYAAAAGGGRAAALGAVAALCAGAPGAAGCTPAGTEGTATPAARGAAATTAHARIPASPAVDAPVVAAAVMAPRAGRPRAAGPEFAFEPAAAARSGAEPGAARAGTFERGAESGAARAGTFERGADSGAARADTFERGAATRPAADGGFERGGTTGAAASRTLERGPAASPDRAVGRDEPATTGAGLERGAPPPAPEAFLRRAPAPAAARTQSTAAATAARAAFERSEPRPTAPHDDAAPRAAGAAFERSAP